MRTVCVSVLLVVTVSTRHRARAWEAHSRADAWKLWAAESLESGAGLMDEDGRRRIAEMAQNVRQRCKRVCEQEKKGKLQEELQKTATGRQEWQAAQGLGRKRSCSI